MAFFSNLNQVFLLAKHKVTLRKHGFGTSCHLTFCPLISIDLFSIHIGYKARHITQIVDLDNIQLQLEKTTTQHKHKS